MIHATSAVFSWGDSFKKKVNVGPVTDTLHKAAEVADVYRRAAALKFDSFKGAKKKHG